MKCPQCGFQNRAGASICDKCDFILDASFLGTDAAPDLGGDETGPRSSPSASEDTQTGPPPRPRAARPSQRGAPPEPEPEAEPPPAPKPARHGSRFIAGGIDDKPLEADDEMAISSAKPTDDDDWRGQLKRERDQQRADAERQARDAPPPPPTNEGDRLVGDLKKVFSKGQGAYKGLSRADQLAVAGAGIMMLMCFFPWVSIERQGSMVGLEVGGWVALLLGGCAGGAVFLRKSPHWQSRPKPIVMGQAGALGLSILFLVSKIVSLQTMKVMVPEADLDMPVSASVQFGVFLALLGALVASYGTWQIFRAEVLKKKG